MATINDAMAEAINDQINAEMYSAYLYLAMAADFEAKNLKGFASWMQVQFLEEWAHAMKMFNYVCERGGRVALAAIEAPQAEWASAEAVFDAVYAHEQKVTGLIDALVGKAVELKDRATENFLQWFVAEQVEEEATADGICRQLELMAGAPGGIFMMDKDLGSRVFTPPAEGA